jgi:dTMP kinase
LSDAKSDELRAAHVESAPDAVLMSLMLRDDERAWALRERAWSEASDEARAQTLQGCVSEAAQKLREKLFEKNPIVGLSSLRSTRTASGDAWLERSAGHAPKLVLAALVGRSDDFAYEMRDALFETGREVIDTVRRLDDPRAHALRERAITRWPSTVLHSLLGLPASARTAELDKRCRELGAGDIHMLRRAQLLDEHAARPEWSERPRAVAEASAR